jgi:S-adenosylmethionine:tRNA ribosyltransferase-isomerase
MENPAHPKLLRIQDFDYSLPESRIAQHPLEERDRSKLLVNKAGLISEDNFFNLSKHLPSDSIVVFNETRVIHARLVFQKETGSFIELFCLEPLAPFRDYQRAFTQRTQSEWLCLVGNSKRWKTGIIVLSALFGGRQIKLSAERISRNSDGTSTIKLTWSPPELTFSQILEAAGKIPLPPYISRNPVEKDELTYQTIYARQDGSVAAPTAGLHFSPRVFRSLKDKNIETLNFILHVGAGTFKPVSSESLESHDMHAEQIILPVESLEKLKESLDKQIIAVGTTTTRLLESLFWHGVKVINGLSDPAKMDVRQWDPYESLRETKISRQESLEAVISGCKESGNQVLIGKTSLMIAPGYTFRFPDILITNFHQPKSTLLLLIAAFVGEDWKKAYRYALAHDFRFLSYGDSCLFFRVNQEKF